VPQAAWSFRAARDTPARARRAVVDWAQSRVADSALLDDIALAITEATTNAVLHAYRDCEQPGTVVVEAYEAGGSLHLLVRDDGSGLVPRLDSPGLGLGLGLIAQLSSEADVRAPAEGGTEVVMRFALARS
jgi:serine/threonine-protein kinase RsbW